jgi:hypothetical protein
MGWLALADPVFVTAWEARGAKRVFIGWIQE